MESKFVVELHSPLYEPQLSRVAAEVANALALSEAKLGRLLGRGVGPLTKPVNKPVAERVVSVIRAAGADAVGVEDAPVAPDVYSTAKPVNEEFVTESPGRDETEKVVINKAATEEVVTDLSPVSLLSSDLPKKEASQKVEVAVADEQVVPKAGQPPNSRPWLIPVVLLVVAVLAFAIYSL